MNRKDTYSTRFNTGYDIAAENIGALQADGWTRDQLDTFKSEMSETESEHYRQFRPFEFFAHDLNEQPNSESLWEGYDAGVTDGIDKRVKEWQKEHKGEKL